MIEGFKTLKAGDVRKDRDEVRHIDENPKGFWTEGHENKKPREMQPGPWEPVVLLGHKILRSDLMAAEFRRPLI